MLVILAGLFLIPSIGLAQKEGLYWYFGVNAGLNFNDGVPKPMTNGALSTTEGCPTISSPTGRLMLYTDGIAVYNGMHKIVPGASDLMGSPDATQSGIIVPVPDDTTVFYVFTVSSLGVAQPANGFRYTMIDTKMNGGQGGVIDGKKNVLIFPYTTERVTSVHHANDYGVWVIMHEWESSRFRAYLVTPNGVSIDNPVISDQGLYHGSYNQHNRNGIGYMKLSPDGKKLAVAVMGLNVVEIFDFNDSTGVISNSMILPVDTVPYGVEFSSNAEFLYASERFSDKIYQWDMQAGSPEDIRNSRQVIATLENPFGGALQMAPDGRIYVARKSKFYLSRINYPYKAGLDCGFEEVGVNLAGRQAKEGLPTFIQSYFNYFWIIQKYKCIDDEIEFSLSSVVNIDSVHWNFGDPESGVANTVKGDTVRHIFTAPGKYTVTATSYFLDALTIKKKLVTIFPLPHVELGNDTAICRGDTVTFKTGTQFLTWKWLDDSTLNLPYYKAFNDGPVTVEVTNVCGEAGDTVYLQVNDYPEVDLGKDTVIEYNTVIMLDAGYYNDNFLWQDGSASWSQLVDYPGIFWVDVWDELGCKSSDTIRIEPVPFTIQVPNAFSPNGDAYNNEFGVYTNYDAVYRFNIMVFNRYGEKVFESHSLDEKWDGKYNDVECPVEVYTWILKAETFEQNAFFPGEIFKTGTVTLLR